jgi:hypothetical protein
MVSDLTGKISCSVVYYCVFVIESEKLIPTEHMLYREKILTVSN